MAKLNLEQMKKITELGVQSLERNFDPIPIGKIEIVIGALMDKPFQAIIAQPQLLPILQLALSVSLTQYLIKRYERGDVSPTTGCIAESLEDVEALLSKIEEEKNNG